MFQRDFLNIAPKVCMSSLRHLQKKPHLKITWPLWGWKTTWLQKIMGVTELFMKALANKWVKLVDKVGYLLALIQFTNKKQTFWSCISKNRFCNLHHFRLHRTYCYSCFLGTVLSAKYIYYYKFAYSPLSNKRAGWNKQAGGKCFEWWKIKKVEILTINKITLFKTNLI